MFRNHLNVVVGKGGADFNWSLGGLQQSIMIHHILVYLVEYILIIWIWKVTNNISYQIHVVELKTTIFPSDM